MDGTPTVLLSWGSWHNPTERPMSSNNKANKRVPFDVMLRVADWMRSNRSDILQQRPTAKQIAGKLTDIIGQEISPSTVLTVRHSLGIEYSPRIDKNVQAYSGHYRSRLAKVEAILDYLVENLNVDISAIDLPVEKREGRP